MASRALHVLQYYGGGSVILERNGLRLVVDDDLGRERALSFAESLGVDSKLDHGEFVTGRRLVGGWFLLRMCAGAIAVQLPA